MSGRVITFFNNKGGVGKTTLVYHIAWMLADLGYRVVAADLDPQANLTAAFLDEEQVEGLWSSSHRRTIWGAIEPFQEGSGSITDAELVKTWDDHLVLLPGDLALSAFEDDLSSDWLNCLAQKARSFRIMSAFHTVLMRASEQHSADFVLVDVGPTLGVINRAALVASDHVVIRSHPTFSRCRVCATWAPHCVAGGNSYPRRLPRPATFQAELCMSWDTCCWDTAHD
jgi:chromosome partitioning protein